MAIVDFNQGQVTLQPTNLSFRFSVNIFFAGPPLLERGGAKIFCRSTKQHSAAAAAALCSTTSGSSLAERNTEQVENRPAVEYSPGNTTMKRKKTEGCSCVCRSFEPHN